MAALVYAVTALLGAGATVVGVAGMLGAPWAVRVDWLVPLGGLRLEMDPLAGVFVALVGVTAIPTSLYAIGYTGRERRGCLAYAAFVGAMLCVPLAANVMTFVLAWELMSLASYVLVLDGARAGRETAASAHAVCNTQSPSSLIKPVSSASGMNSAGETMPRSGWRQRSSASTPTTRPVRNDTCGW